MSNPKSKKEILENVKSIIEDALKAEEQETIEGGFANPIDNESQAPKFDVNLYSCQ